MKESAFIRRYIRPYLEGLGARVVKVHGSAFSEVGVADLLVCLGGHFIALEVKMHGNIPSPAQLNFIRSVEKAGGRGGIVYSHTWREDVDKILDK